jgi:glycosyltransferase involved in cell wall biosynthesis
MRIGLDVTPVVTSHAGLARYSQELWQALAAREDVHVSAFALGRGQAPTTPLPVNRVPIPLRVLRPTWALLGRPRAEFFAGEVDLVHSLALRPAPTRKPSVQTIHDLLPLTHTHLYPPSSTRVHGEEVAEAVHADLVLTTCEATAREITRFTGIPRERIAVASPGTFVADSPQGHGTRDGPYLLVVGQITPRKGLDVLARAAALLGTRCPPILAAGPDWWRADEVRREIDRFDTGGRIRLLGAVTDEELATLYQNATVVCHTSRAEGFGMTCLEAMSAGAPVVATDLPSVRELTAGCASLVPVDDPDALAAAVADLLGDDERRRSLAMAGRERAAAFTWPKMAADVVVAYRGVLAR